MNAVAMLLFAAIGCLIIGTWTQLRLSKSVQTLRLQLADEGERFLAREDVPKAMKNQVEMFLDSVFGMNFVLIASVVLLPVAAIVFSFFDDHMRRGIPADSSIPREILAEFIDLMKMHDKIMLANHPVLYTIIKTEMALLAPVSMLIIGIRKKAVPDQFEALPFLASLELKETKLFRLKHAA